MNNFKGHVKNSIQSAAFWSQSTNIPLEFDEMTSGVADPSPQVTHWIKLFSLSFYFLFSCSQSLHLSFLCELLYSESLIHHDVVLVWLLSSSFWYFSLLGMFQSHVFLVRVSPVRTGLVGLCLFILCEL